MKFFRPKYPTLLKLLYPGRISNINNDKAIYLTFDDGPVPEVTPWVLDLLQQYNAKASFFCIGDNVRKHPEISQRVLAEGHCIGNHTYNHLNGWKNSTSDYIENIKLAEEVMKRMGYEKKSEDVKTPHSELGTTSSNLQTPNFKLFRPPYGRIKNSQAKSLKKAGYKMVMWDVISGDYNKDFSAGQCYKNVIENASAGSIIVFHDSKKAFRNLKETLPKILQYYTEKGLEFRSLTDVL